MNIEQIRAATSEGHCVYGTMVASTSPHWPALLSKAGLDFVFLDTEHIAIDRQTLSWMCRAYAAAGIAPIVRISSPDPYAAVMALDGGASGVVAPYVETVQQVEALRGAVKLRR
jgi:2-keto-3-deoxy-L-rhamnonate aldolase RhmA